MNKCLFDFVCMHIHTYKHMHHIYIYIYIYYIKLKPSNLLWVFNKSKSNNNWTLHCVLWINSNLQMATIFLKNKNRYIKARTKLFVKQQDIFKTCHIISQFNLTLTI